MGVIALANSLSEPSNEMKKLIVENENLINSSRELNAEIEGNIASRQENVADIEAEIGAARGLADGLFDLADKENKSNGDKAAMSALVDELNGKIPELALTLNAETGELNLQRQEVDKLITSQLELLKLKAAGEDLTRIAKDQYNAEKSLAELQEQRAEMQGKVNANTAEQMAAFAEIYNVPLETAKEMYAQGLVSTGEVGRELREEVGKFDAQILETKETLKKSGVEWDKTTEYIGNGTAEIKKSTAALGDNATAEQELATEKKKSFDENVAIMDKKRAIGQMSDAEYYAELSKMLKDAKADEMGIYNDYYAEIYSYQKSANKTSLSAAKLSAKELTKVQEDIFKDWSGSVSSLVDETEKGFNEIAKKRESLQSKLESFGGLFERKKLSKDSDETEVVLNDLNKTAQKLEEYGAALEALKAAGASSAFLSEVTAMGVDDGLDFAKVLTEKSQSELENYLKSWQKNKDIAAKIAEEFYKDEVDSLQTNFVDKFNSLLEVMPKDLTAIGTDTMQGFIDGLNSKLSEVTKLSSYIAEEVAKAFAKPIEINSPSKVFKRFGEYTMEGYGIGLEGGSDSVMGIAKEQGKRIISAFGDGDISKSVSFDVGGIPPEFYGLGQTSAEEFSTGFKEKMKLLLSNVKNVVDVTMAGLTPRLAVAGAAAAAGNTSKIELTQINNSPKAIGAYEANKGLRELEQRLARRL